MRKATAYWQRNHLDVAMVDCLQRSTRRQPRGVWMREWRSRGSKKINWIDCTKEESTKRIGRAHVSTHLGIVAGWLSQQNGGRTCGIGDDVAGTNSTLPLPTSMSTQMLSWRAPRQPQQGTSVQETDTETLNRLSSSRAGQD